MIFSVNTLAVAICAIFYFVHSCLWFGKVYERRLFKDVMVSQEEMRLKERRFTRALLFHFISGYGFCIVMSLLIHLAGATTLWAGVRLGLLCWLGMAVVVDFGSFFNENCRGVKDVLVHNAFHLINAVVLGGVLAIWR